MMMAMMMLVLVVMIMMIMVMIMMMMAAAAAAAVMMVMTQMARNRDVVSKYTRAARHLQGRHDKAPAQLRLRRKICPQRYPPLLSSSPFPWRDEPWQMMRRI